MAESATTRERTIDYLTWLRDLASHDLDGLPAALGMSEGEDARNNLIDALGDALTLLGDGTHDGRAADPERVFAVVRWTAADLMPVSDGINAETGEEVIDRSHAYFKTEAEAVAWWEEHEFIVQDLMTERGWDAIQELIDRNICEECEEPYDSYGDGFAGLCPGCADKKEGDE